MYWSTGCLVLIVLLLYFVGIRVVYFVGNAQLLRRLIAVETALSANAKIVVPSNTELVNMAGILPLNRSTATAKSQGSVPATADPSMRLSNETHPLAQNRPPLVNSLAGGHQLESGPATHR